VTSLSCRILRLFIRGQPVGVMAYGAPHRVSCFLHDYFHLFISALSLNELYYGGALRKNSGKEQSAEQTLQVIEEIKNDLFYFLLRERKL
jgi:hypothetical protein